MPWKNPAENLSLSCMDIDVERMKSNNSKYQGLRKLMGKEIKEESKSWADTLRK
jgi:hypothetical protein